MSGRCRVCSRNKDSKRAQDMVPLIRKALLYTDSTHWKATDCYTVETYYNVKLDGDIHKVVVTESGRPYTTCVHILRS